MLSMESKRLCCALRYWTRAIAFTFHFLLFRFVVVCLTWRLISISIWYFVNCLGIRFGCRSGSYAHLFVYWLDSVDVATTESLSTHRQCLVSCKQDPAFQYWPPANWANASIVSPCHCTRRPMVSPPHWFRRESSASSLFVYDSVLFMFRRMRLAIFIAFDFHQR